MVFATASLAGRIERAETTLVADAAEGAARRLGRDRVFVRTLNGGVAVHAGEGSPFNKVAGLGFGGMPAPEALDEVEREFATRRQPVRVEISTLADPAIARGLTRRGYELTGFENVLGLALDARVTGPSLSRPPDPSVLIQKIRPDEAAEWTGAVTTAFLSPDTFDGPASDEEFPRDVLERAYDDMAACPGFERYIARIDGVVAAGASLRIVQAVAQLCGAGTLPQFRRRGIQSALLRQRLIDAAAVGCDVAVVTTQPGSKSQENVQRFGFELLYARAVLTKGA
jgi:ribosomal protein S18 acetylase RimI-like enzyme